MKLFVISSMLFLFCQGMPAYSQDLESRLTEHYVGKPVVVRIPIPDDKQTMLVYMDKEEKFDKGLYEHKLKRVGIGLEPEVVAVIKEVKVNNKEMTFHFIGVGFELPDKEFTTQLLDKNIIGQGAGKVRFKFNQSIDESTQIDTVNSWLSLIVSTRALITDEGLPEAVKVAIKENKVVTGMNRKAVYLSLGDPSEVLRELKDGSLIEAWIYEKEDFSAQMIVFNNGRVVSVTEF